MKIAKLARLQGEIIEAKTADYHDYNGMLLCPCCSEPVFLRKAHARNGKSVAASFVHHRGDEDECELRVESLSLKQIESINSQARNQRLVLLQNNCWEMLKSAECYSLAQPRMKKFINQDKLFYLDTKKILTRSFNDSGCRLEYKILLSKMLENNIIKGKQLRSTDDGIVTISYEMVKNAEIIREVIGFCLSAKGKLVLIEMVPTLCFLCKHILDDRRKFEEILGKQLLEYGPKELILLLHVTVILNWFLGVNWVEEFSKKACIIL